MSEDRNGADIGVKVGGQEVNIKNIKSLNTILTALSLGAIIGFGVMLWMHSEVEAKNNTAVLQEIKEQNRRGLEAQKSSAFYSCIQACLLEQQQEKRNAAVCERQCAPVKQ